MKEPLVSIRNLSYSYASPFLRKRKEALSGISFEIYEGERIAVIGPSGSGKSTLLQSINGLVPHCRKGRMSGSVVTGGMDTAKNGVAAISAVVGMVFQDPDHQILRNDVDSEIAFALEQSGLSSAEIEDAISEVTCLMKIGHLRGREIAEISWGEKQKVAIASVLVSKPRLLLLDEPLSGLDPESASYLLDILESINRSENISIVLVEHRIDVLDSFAERILYLDSGKVVLDHPATEVFFGKSSAGDLFSEFRSFRQVTSNGDSLFAGSESPGNGSCQESSLRLENISFTYPGRDKPVLWDISAEFFPGQAVAIYGPNGSGKSTLSKQMNRLLSPDNGRILFFGENIVGWTVAETAAKVALLSQHADYQLFAETLEEEIAFGPGNLGTERARTEYLTDNLLEILDLGHLGRKAHPLKFSVGEKQRVAIAGYLAMDTPVVVMDEPTLGLDPVLKQNLIKIIGILKQRGKTVIIFTHDRNFGSSFAEKEYYIGRGQLSEL